MNTSTRLRKYLFVCLTALAVFTGLAGTAEATHGRYGSITWSVPNPATPNVIKVRVETAWRRSFFGAPVIGTTIALGSVLVTADGGPAAPPGSFALNPTVTSVNTVEDWVMTVQETNYTFPAATANYMLSFDTCCRISTLRDGNNDINFRLTSRVTVRMPPNAINRPPITATLPIVSLPLNIVSSFTVPAFDPDGDAMTFRIATNAESTLNTLAPAGFVINSAGVVTWTPTAAGLYTTQVVVTDSQNAYTVVDLILSVAAPTGMPPAIKINNAPGPLSLSVAYGTPISLTISATDPENASIYLNTGSLPAGSTTTPSLPLQLVNPSTTFTWTPTLAQLGTYVLTFGATDPVGNQATTSVTITVRTNPATITCSANDNSFEAGGAPFALTANVADPDGTPVTVRFFVDGIERQSTINVPVPSAVTYTSSTLFMVGSHTYEGRVSDGASPTQSCTGTFTIVDTTNPTITVPANINVMATSPAGKVVSYVVTGYDLGDPTPTIACVPPSGSTFPFGTTTVACTVSDDSGNSVSGSFTVRVFDNILPVITLLGADPQQVQAGTAYTELGATASDNVDGNIPGTLVANTTALNTNVPGTYTVTYRVTDTAGNIGTKSRTVQVVDTLKPVMPVVPPVTVEATSPAGAVVTYPPLVATDTVSGSITAVCTPASGSMFPLGTTTVSCTATDGSQNSAIRTFNVNVVDTQAPVLTVPASMSVVGTSPAGATVTYVATATDATTASPVVVCAPPSGSTFPYGPSSVSCVASDSVGNQSTKTFSVTVTDPTPPVITPVVVGTAGQNGWYISPPTLSWTVVDAETGVSSSTGCSVQAALADTTGVSFTCQATNGQNMTASASITIKVDTVSPTSTFTVLTAPSVNGGGVEATSSVGAMVFYGTTITDATSGPGVVNCMPTTGSVFALGITQVDCIAFDVAGNMRSQQFSVAVVDTTPPNVMPVSLPSPVAEATGPAGAAVAFQSPNIRDIADANPTITCLPGSGATFPLGTTPVTCTATDASGNSRTYTDIFSVLVRDTTAPALTLLGPSPQIIQGATPYVEQGATALDIYDGNVTTQIVINASAVDTDVVGTYSVSYSVTDAAGNTSHATRTVSVVDTTPPVLPTLPSLSVEAASSNGSPVSYTVADAIDAVAGSIALTCVPPSGSVFPQGMSTVICTATDPSGNTAADTFNVQVADTIAPVLALPPNIVAIGTGASGATVAFAATATDAVTTSLVVSCAPASGSVFPFGTTTVSCSVVDAAGNTSTGSFTVTVTDTTPPVVVPTVVGTAGSNGWYVSNPTLSWSVTDVESGIASSTGCAVQTAVADTTGVTFTCEATNGDGLHTSVSATLKVDTVDPTSALAVLTATNGDGSVEATSATGAVVAYSVTVNDATSGDAGVTNCTPASGSVFALGNSSVSCVASDVAGNTRTQAFTIKVADTTSPVMPALTNLTREAASNAGTVTTFTVPNASDVVAGSLALTCTPGSPSLFPQGVSTVTCTVADPSGNQASATFTVTVADTTAPALTVPANINVLGTGPSGATVTFAATATDAVTSSLVIGCTPASGSVFAYGTTTVSCTVADAAGNTSNGSFTVTVTDPTPPVVTPVVTGTPGTNGWYTSNVNVSWVITDPESNFTSTACAATVVSADGTASITCSATSEGGTTSITQAVKRDVTAPAITTSASLIREAVGASGAPVTYTGGTAIETTSGLNGAVVCVPASGSLFSIGTSTVTCSAADLAGNASSATFTVTVRDTTPPVISATTPSTGQLWPPNHQMVPLTIAVAVTDIASTAACTVTGVTSNEPQNGLGDGDTPNDWLLTGGLNLQLRSERAGNGNGRVYTVAVRCTDGFGNETTASTTVGVAKSQGKK